MQQQQQHEVSDAGVLLTHSGLDALAQVQITFSHGSGAPARES